MADSQSKKVDGNVRAPSTDGNARFEDGFSGH